MNNVCECIVHVVYERREVCKYCCSAFVANFEGTDNGWTKAVLPLPHVPATLQRELT